jgi:WD repeat-containing protein 19
MYELGSTKTPLELVFEAKYGKIIDYCLFGDGYIVIGFSEGYVAHISTHIKELSNA